MLRPRHIFKPALLILLLCTCYLIWDQVAFEHYLTSLSIDFDDLPADYVAALKDSVKNNHQLVYDDYSSFDALQSNETIPPIIHFIWFENLYDDHGSKSKIPSKGSQAPELCRLSSDTAHANFTINVWNATAARALMEESYSWFLPTYDSYRHPIQRVDAFKYFVLWHYGGIYMDMDIACRPKQPVVPLLSFPAWFPRTELLGVNNDMMAARATHPVIGEMTKALQKRNINLLFPYLTVYFSSGPQFASDVLKGWFHQGRSKHKAGASKEHANPDDFFILPQGFYGKEYSFVAHRAGGTWHGADVVVVNWLIDHPWSLYLIVLALTMPCALLVLWVKLRSRAKHRRAEYSRLAQQDEYDDHEMSLRQTRSHTRYGSIDWGR